MERDQVIKGLESCTSGRGAQCCYGCPYAFLEDGQDCSEQLMKDALALIKEGNRYAEIPGTQ